MISPRWMILLCFSLISVIGTGESLTPIEPSKTVAPSSLAAVIAGMNKAIADLNASNKKLLAYKKGISCSCNASVIQACNNQTNLLNRGLISCDSQLKSEIAQRTSLQQQVTVLNSQLRSEIAQRSSVEQQANALRSQLTSVTQQRDALQSKINVFERYQNEGWTYFRGSLYYVSTSTANWQNSREYCTSRAADLVVINDADENNFTRGFGRRFWIGLFRQGSNWMWVDGSYLSSGYWAPGEPNNQGNREDRVEIRIYNNFNSWNDEPGSTSNCWICEKKVV
uniref:C-type lectin domain family 4 member M-like n=1 Tax=Oryzias latipes TaxID=8090 RepID=A0A3P9JT25_ORYLA